MGSTTLGIVMVLVFGGWHIQTRRHRNWRRDALARFWITGGYPLAAVAVYFLFNSAHGLDWMWVLGCGWALLAMISLIYGFQALNAEPSETPLEAAAPVPS